MKFLQYILKPGALKIIGAALTGGSLVFAGAGWYWSNQSKKEITRLLDQQHEIKQDSLLMKTFDLLNQHVNDKSIYIAFHEQSITLNKVIRSVNTHNEVLKDVIKATKALNEDTRYYLYRLQELDDSLKKKSQLTAKF